MPTERPERGGWREKKTDRENRAKEGEEDSLDVGKDTTLSDDDSREKLVQLLVITDGKLQMSWDDSGLLVVTGSIAWASPCRQ